MGVPRTAVVWLSLTLGEFALGQHPKLHPELLGTDADEVVNVIVRYKPDKTSAQDAVDTRMSTRGAILRHKLPLLHAASFSMSRRDLELLAADPEVEYVAPDRRVRATAFRGTADYGWMAVTGIYAPSGTLP